MRLLIGLVCLLFVGNALSANSHLENLQYVDEIFLTEHKLASQMLSTIPVEQLDDAELAYYDYLTVLTSTINTELPEITSQYEALLERVSDPNIRIRILGSLLNILGNLKDWERGLQIVSELVELLNENPNSLYSANGYLNLALFYLNIRQPETTLYFVNKIFSTEHVSLKIECQTYLASLASRVKLAVDNIELADFSDAESVCARTEQNYTIVNINIWKAKWLLDKKRFDEVENVLLTSIKQAESFSANGQIIEIYSLFSALYYAVEKYSEAKAYANQALAMEAKSDYPIPMIEVYDVLRRLAENESNYALAYRFLTLLQELENAVFKSQLSDEIAIQKAWFEIDAKQNQIELLDKQNTLLTTTAKLSAESLENSLLALALVSLLLASLLFWSYRSHKLQAKLKYYARTDMLTQIANRGYFTEQFTQALTQAQKSNKVVSLILLDLDHFKNINDSYGHQVGDWALQQVADIIRQTVYKDAIVGRLGGEEFGIVVPGEQGDAGLRIAEQCRLQIEKIESTISEYQFKLTVSAGVSNTSQVGYKLENLYAAADLALYQSKQYGRNRVYEYSTTMAS